MLPAIWVGEPLHGIVDSVADALVGTLPADVVALARTISLPPPVPKWPSHGLE
jgi:hypothetical protein